jgi:predicted ATPase
MAAQGIEMGVVTPEASGGLLSLPTFLAVQPGPSRITPTFVDRHPELALLDRHLEQAMDCHGHVVFVTGDAGMGKTALIQEFCRRAQEVHEDLVVAGGRCLSHRGVGDPFLPFRDMLAQLTGDLEASWTAGELTRNHAQRLWNLFPPLVETLVTHGPDLIGSFVSTRALADRVTLLPGIWPQLATAAESFHGDKHVGQTTGPSQAALFDQWTRVMSATAKAQPLLLWLDDLQWGDLDSIALLFHLGQRLSGSRVLIVAAYRPEEVALGRNGRRHPLEKVIHEMLQRAGAAVLDLSQSDGRSFIDAYLDTQPNRLSQQFRDTLFRHSGGHPLFTTELVGSLQERGDLVPDARGGWMEGPQLDWDIFPARVEATIAERVARLPLALRPTLAVAAVQGEHFSAEVLADVLGFDVRHVMEVLSGVLDRQHHLVIAHGIQRVNGRRLAIYRFRHNLFQKYVYECLDTVERSRRHEDVAEALTRLHEQASGNVAAIAARLGWHYRQAGVIDKAISSLVLAGKEAIRLSAYDEAMASFTEGLSLLAQLPSGPATKVQELNLLMGLGAVRAMTLGDADRDTERTFMRARHVCRQVGDTRRQYHVSWRLWHCNFQRGNLHKALQLGQSCLELAQREADPALLVEARASLAGTLQRFGFFRQALDELAKARKICDAGFEHRPTLGQELIPEVQTEATACQVLWYLGFTDRALASSQAALSKAEEAGHPFSQAFALVFAAGLHQRGHNAAQAALFASKTIDLSRAHGFSLWAAVGGLYHGWALAAQGNVGRGLAEARQASDAILATGMDQFRYRAVLADVCRMANRIDESQAWVEQILCAAQRANEREWEAEMHRLRGDLILAQDIPHARAEAEKCYQQAIEVARRQDARSLELRATISLCRLWRTQGRSVDSMQQLQAIMSWFPEGCYTPDYKDAQALLAAGRHFADVH